MLMKSIYFSTSIAYQQKKELQMNATPFPFGLNQNN